MRNRQNPPVAAFDMIVAWHCPRVPDLSIKLDEREKRTMKRP